MGQRTALPATGGLFHGLQDILKGKKKGTTIGKLYTKTKELYIYNSW